MAITVDLLEAFLKCPTKCFLRAREEAETGNAYADWVRTKSDVFRGEGIKRLLAGAKLDDCATGTEGIESRRLAQIQSAADFFAESENLRSSCHAVERIPSSGRGRAAQLIPIRFAFSNKITRHDKLLLAFDALVISKVLAREVALGRVVYGDDHATLNVKVSLDAKRNRRIPYPLKCLPDVQILRLGFLGVSPLG